MPAATLGWTGPVLFFVLCPDLTGSPAAGEEAVGPATGPDEEPPAGHGYAGSVSQRKREGGGRERWRARRLLCSLLLCLLCLLLPSPSHMLSLSVSLCLGLSLSLSVCMSVRLSVGVFVYLEPLWLEQSFSCFTDCDDWAW